MVRLKAGRHGVSAPQTNADAGRNRIGCRGPDCAGGDAPAKPRARMMRQYDLVERVRSYNPNTDEDLLNRAYVYAMKAHGAQTRASGDPYFSHPLEVAAILTDLKLDDATIVAALLHDTIEDTEATRAEIDQTVRPRDRRAGRGPDQAEAARAGVARGQAGREPAQIVAGHRRRRPRAAGQARRPPAQHAHAGLRAAGIAPAHCRGDARHLCAAGRPHGHAGNARGAGGSVLPHARSRSLFGGDAAARCARRAQPQPDRRDRGPALQQSAPHGVSARGSMAAARSRSRSGPRWSASRSASSSCPTSSASASSSTTSRPAIARSASSTPTGRSCPGVSRTTSRRRSRTTTARSTPP